jgi:hypothetical protein
MGCPLVLAARLHRRRRTTGPQRRHRRYRRGGARLAVCAPQATQAVGCFVSTSVLCFCWAAARQRTGDGGRGGPLAHRRQARPSVPTSSAMSICIAKLNHARKGWQRAGRMNARIASRAASGKARTVPVIAHRCQRFRPAACLDGCTAALAQGCAPSPPRATERRLS